MPRIPFSPPVIPDSPFNDLKNQFDILKSYLIRTLFPYLANYLVTTNDVDAIRCNANLAPMPFDGVNTTFTLAQGAIRLAPDGSPQAVLMKNFTLMRYGVDWMLVGPPMQPQQHILLTVAPAPADIVQFVFAILA